VQNFYVISVKFNKAEICDNETMYGMKILNSA